MRKLVVVAVGLLMYGTLGFSQAAKGSNADVEQKLTAAEKQLWEAWKNKDMGPFKQHLTDDTVMVDPGGITHGKDKAVDFMTKNPCDVKSYSLGDMKVDWIDKDTALVTYKAQSDATCGGQKTPESVYAASLWVKKNGKWLGAFHQETAAAPAQ
jgi:hypothetical protein